MKERASARLRSSGTVLDLLEISLSQSKKAGLLKPTFQISYVAIKLITGWL